MPIMNNPAQQAADDMKRGHLVSVDKSTSGEIEKVISLHEGQLDVIANMVAQKLRATPMSDSDLSNLAEKVTNYLCGKDHNGAKEPEPVPEYPLTAKDCVRILTDDDVYAEFISENGARWTSEDSIRAWIGAELNLVCFRRFQ